MSTTQLSRLRVNAVMFYELARNRSESAPAAVPASAEKEKICNLNALSLFSPYSDIGYYVLRESLSITRRKLADVSIPPSLSSNFDDHVNYLKCIGLLMQVKNLEDGSVMLRKS